MSTIEWGEHVETSDEVKREILNQFAEPVTSTEQATGNSSRWSDARHIRSNIYPLHGDDDEKDKGISPWDTEPFDFEDVLPDCWIHEWDTGGEMTDGGTDFLARGKPGKGKSTLANFAAVRMMEINDEKVVWRGSSSRSEWLPLAPWTVLCLPENVPVNVRLESKIKSEPPVEITVDELEDIVREVRRYSNPVDLNRNHLDHGQFHVVYPDPLMRGCQEIYERDPEKEYDVPPKRETLFSEEDPANHWWFAWALARVNHGPHHFTTWICDEVGDIAPQGASKDSYGTLQKIEMMKDMWVDARKFGLSIFLFGHSEVDIHQKIRHKIRWRIQMAHTANPTTATKIVGFESVGPDKGVTDEYDIGEALMYNETHYQPFTWDDMPSPTSYKLKIEVGR